MFDSVPSAFAEIRAPGANLVRVPRVPSPALRDAVARALAAKRPDFDVQVERHAVDAVFAAHVCDPVLAADMASLAREFAAASAACAVRARFERIEGPACKLFHVDFVACRLITTYSGAGTEYLADEDVDRARLGQGANRGVKKPGAAVRHLDAFEIGLFKGEAWPGNRGKGIVHRSPPASRARPRLIFVLDALCGH
ncbi:MAG: DUF1826 domain-containing protein [Tagaea sp.]|nr:DUF1826 domain-containing protein [Tagaea sp.]